MRTTLAIDDDVLLAARAIARQRNQTVGQVVSELARKALRPPAASTERNGVPAAAGAPARCHRHARHRQCRCATSCRDVFARREPSDCVDRSHPCRARCRTPMVRRDRRRLVGNVPSHRERRDPHRGSPEIPKFVGLARCGRTAPRAPPRLARPCVLDRRFEPDRFRYCRCRPHRDIGSSHGHLPPGPCRRE